jgi:sugar/nucleoside kinase (ribokinase family)
MSTWDGPIVVVGDVMTDVVAPSGGSMPTADAPDWPTTRQAGSGATVAHWLARLGAPTAFVGRVGDDPFGVEATAVLQVAGVDVHVATDPHLPTGSCVVINDGDGRLSRLADAGANSALSLEALPVALLRSARWVHVSGYTVLNPGSREAGVAALRLAREAGVPTSVDTADAAPLQAVGAKEFLALTEGVDLAFCGLDEAEVLCDSREPAVVSARLTAAYPQLVLMLGGQAAQWCSAQDVAGCRVVTPRPAGQVLDASGARDAFVAAYVAYATGPARRPGPVGAYPGAEAVRHALTRACELAAQVATKAGSRPV